jgi:hypothetical protein
MNLQNDISFSELSNILDNQLINSFTPHVEAIPNVQSKGIYFWFMKQSAYDVLSQFVPVTPIEPRYTKIIDNQTYDLVYLGTAGVRNNSNGINNGNIFKRLKWHLDENKSISSLCSGSMSTFRRTLGALINNDLISDNVQVKIDNFIKQHFIIFYIEYQGAFIDIKDVVDNDESILINLFKPIFNLAKNPNAEIPTNSTYRIQQRRQVVENNSKKRWCNQKPNAKTKKIIPKPNKIKSSASKVADYGNCVEFQLARNQNIATIANGISNLHVGPCSIELFYENSTDVRLYVNNGERNIRTKNRTISEYFISPDTKNGNIPKWQIVQNEMNEPNRIIEEITVRVCSNGNEIEISNTTKNKKKSSKNKNTDKKNNSSFNQTNEFSKLVNSLNLDKLKTENGPKLLIIGCSNSKSTQPNSLDNDNYENYNFGNQIISCREIRKNYYREIPINYFNGQNRNGVIVDKPYFMNALNNNRQKALELYGSNRSPFFNPQIKNIYRLKIQDSNLHLLIISGLYGLLKHNDFINDYHLTINKGANIWGNSITNAINQYVQENQIDHDSVFYSLSDEYLNKINPNTQWKNLWIKNGGSGSLTSSAKFLKEYFLPNL